MTPTTRTMTSRSSATLDRPDRRSGAADDLVSALRRQFAPAPGYLNAATMGLPPRSVTAAVHDAVDQWQRGRACPIQYDRCVNTARNSYACLVRVPASWVALGAQTSVFAGMVAAALPDGSEVVVPEGDFSSMIFPFLVQQRRGVRVQQVPLEKLAEAIGTDTSLVAFSLCQSADGRLCDSEAVCAAAKRYGATTFVDLTQAAGWLPIDATAYDMSVCSAYKWLCQPRGTAYLTVRPEVADRLTPVNAGWYAGEDIWASCYGPEMTLARSARRFDVSPAWLAWVGAVPALEALGSVPAAQIRDWDTALADELCGRLGLPVAHRPIVSIRDPQGTIADRLAAAGVVVASRAGAVRIALHIWNSLDDIDLVTDALKDLSVAKQAGGDRLS